MDERRVVRLEWRYAYSRGDGRVAKEYAAAELDSASGAWLSARWAVDDPGGRFPPPGGKDGTPSCISWSRSENIRVLVGEKSVQSFAPPEAESTKWLPWPVAVLTYLESGDRNADSHPFMTPLWSGVESVSPVLANDARGSLVRWTSSAGNWSVRQGATPNDLALFGGLSGSGTGEAMERTQHEFFKSNVLDNLIASCP